MSSNQNSTKKARGAHPFDEGQYAEALVKAGMSPEDAISLARRTAEARRQSAAVEQAETATSLTEILSTPSMTEAIDADKPDGAAVSDQEKDADSEAPRTSRARARKLARTAKEKPIAAVFDYRNGKIPDRVRDLIEAHLEIEREDAKSAGTLGFMTRALAIATLPHRRQSDFRFVRKNGDFTLTMMTAHPLGLPFGTVPRMLLTWVCTEAVKTGDRVLNLGDSLADYLDELGLHSSGGKRGDITRLKHAMTTLFSSVISCHYEGADTWALSNVLLADRIEWWEPQNEDEAGQWQSTLQLSEPFYRECIEHPLPIDIRAMRALGQSPLALDIYVWLTHRMSYLSRRTIIPWVSLAGQFGSGYADNDQGLRDFKRAFLRELKHVLVVYPEARLADSPSGLVMHPSPTHVPFNSSPKPKQRRLPI